MKLTLVVYSNKAIWVSLKERGRMNEKQKRRQLERDNSVVSLVNCANDSNSALNGA